MGVRNKPSVVSAFGVPMCPTDAEEWGQGFSRRNRDECRGFCARAEIFFLFRSLVVGTVHLFHCKPICVPQPHRINLQQAIWYIYHEL